MSYMYTMEYYSAVKKNGIMPFAATWMDLEIIILSEVSQTEKDKYHDITYMWNLKQDTNEHIYERETDGKKTLPRRVLAKGSEVRENLNLDLVLENRLVIAKAGWR